MTNSQLDTTNESQEVSPFPAGDNNHIQGVHGQRKSQGKTYFFKVRELSGNFEIGQGNLKIKQEVREMSGNFEITSF